MDSREERFRPPNRVLSPRSLYQPASHRSIYFNSRFLSSFPDFWPSHLGEGTRGKQPPRIITLVSDAEIPQLPSLHGDSPWLLIVSRSTCQRLSLLFFLSLLLFSIFFQLRAGYRACLLTFSITNVNALYHWRKMIDEADKFSRMIYTMTLCFDGEKKRKEKIKLGDKLQTNYILYCVTIEFFRWGFCSREYGDESFHSFFFN